MGRHWTGTGAAHNSGQPVVMYACQRWGLKFADESYIGHKNKSSRAIGTYKRSKSAAVLQSDGSSGYIGDGDVESRHFQEPKLGQQTWSSESVLTHTETIEGPALGSRREEKDSSDDRVGPGLEYRDDTSRSVPVRPARSGVHGRYSLGQIQAPPTLSASPVSQNSNTASASSSSSVNLFAAKPFVSDQRSNGARRESPRRHPPTLADSSYNPVSPASRSNGQDFPHPTNSQQKPGAGSEGRQFNNTAPSQNTSAKKNDFPDINNKWNIHNNNNYATTLPPSSSHDGVIKLNPEDNGLPIDTTQQTLTQRDYQRRESAPVRTTINPTSSEKMLDVPLGDSVSSSRRRSDSSLNHAQQTDQGGYDSSASHSRQPSQEELECDEKAKQLAQELENKEQKLSEVLRLDANKKRMQYMDGLFSNSADPGSPGDRPTFNPETRLSLKNHSPQHAPEDSIDKLAAAKRSSLPKEYWMSPSKALLEMELRKNEEISKDLTKDINDSSTLMKHKEELMEKLHKKLEVLKEEKVSLQQEIADNNMLGQQVCKMVDGKCQNQSEREKFKTYIEDLEKIVRLLLNLSGQLARAENAVQALGPQVDSKLKKLTIDKRERLFAKHEEAKFLKEDIDKRSEPLSGLLRERLTDREFTDYTHFIKMKSKLTIELQELDDKITLGEEQILELKKSIPDPIAS
ncbi:hypothetical protein BsWGS_18085 [Bradybaena similaris]